MFDHMLTKKITLTGVTAQSLDQLNMQSPNFDPEIYLNKIHERTPENTFKKGMMDLNEKSKDREASKRELVM
jgi:hypothetical protein